MYTRLENVTDATTLPDAAPAAFQIQDAVGSGKLPPLQGLILYPPKLTAHDDVQPYKTTDEMHCLYVPAAHAAHASVPAAALYLPAAHGSHVPAAALSSWPAGQLTAAADWSPHSSMTNATHK